MFRNNKLVFLSYQSLCRLPAPSNISYLWNLSSLVSLCLAVQVLSGFFLSFHYSGTVSQAFLSVMHIEKDINYSWILRFIHINSASFFMLFIYSHISRGVYYKRYQNYHTWLVGSSMLLISMLTAFLSYVLPWGQMSFWGATVITNLISAFPFSETMVNWVWGGFSVAEPTLNRFYSLHFILPFVLVFLLIIHIFYIHEVGSSNPLGHFSGSLKLDFWPYFSVKDILGLVLAFLLLSTYVFFFTHSFTEPDNYILANPMVTPLHIQPEWYFLFAYAMLRSIPNKLFSVLVLVFSIMVLFFFPLGISKLSITPMYQVCFWMWSFNFILLTWLSGCQVKSLFNLLSQLSGLVYFLMLVFMLVIYVS